MKKVIVLALAFGLTAAAYAANDCGCTKEDVTCINNCTLSKVSALRKNIQAKKENAAAKVKTAKENASKQPAVSETAKAKAKE